MSCFMNRHKTSFRTLYFLAIVLYILQRAMPLAKIPIYTFMQLTKLYAAEHQTILKGFEPFLSHHAVTPTTRWMAWLHTTQKLGT